MRICLTLSRMHARCAGKGCPQQSECWLRNHWGPAWFDSAIWEAATPPRSCNPVIKRKEYQLSFPTPPAKDPASARPTSKELVASPVMANLQSCLLYTSDAADDLLCVDL